MIKETHWRKGEPPKDGNLYVIIGRILWAFEGQAGSNPVLSYAKYGKGGDWLDQHGLSVNPYPEDKFVIDYYSPVPSESEVAR